MAEGYCSFAGVSALVTVLKLWQEFTILAKVGCMSRNNGSTHHTVIFVRRFPDAMFAERNSHVVCAA